MNDRITYSPVRLVDHDGTQIGVVSLDEAKRTARERGLDLVEVAGTARPIVCKILDYGQFKFDAEKKAKESRKQQHQVELKEVKLRPNIDEHDFQTKVRMAERFLKQGKHVKVTIMFRMREMRRPENGYRVLERAREELAAVSTVERPAPAKLEGRDLSMVLRHS